MNNNIREKQRKSKICILILDDDESILKTMDIALRGLGYQTVTCRRTKGLLNTIRRKRPHLLIVDHFLSEETGAQVIEKIRSEKDLEKLPIIAISAHPQVEKNLGNAGANAFISKPFGLSDLDAAIQSVV